MLGGNIGKAVLDLPPFADGRHYVIEFSSFQLDLTPSLDRGRRDPAQRHAGPSSTGMAALENYAAVKEKIFAQCETAAVIGADDALLRRHRGASYRARRPDVPDFGKPSGEYRHLRRRQRAFRGGGRRRPNRASLTGIGSLRGAHNAQNASAALAATRSLGLPWDKLAEALRSFPGLAHRMEEVRRIGHVLFVNNSKATNADAAERALFELLQHLLDRGRQAEGRRHRKPRALSSRGSRRPI